MTLLIASFLAGVLTTLAPCVLPLIPVIVGGAATGTDHDKRATLIRTGIIILSLTVSVVVFTLLLKATTAFIDIPDQVWRTLSGGIVILIGLSYLFPSIWARLSISSGMAIAAQRRLASSQSTTKILQPIAIGASLGPVFTSCSPTYALILAVILPSSFVLGLTYLLAYALGMALTLGVVAYFGSRLVRKLSWTLDERGWFRIGIGVLFIVIGFAVILAFDKTAAAWLLERGVYDGSTSLETLFTE